MNKKFMDYLYASKKSENTIKSYTAHINSMLETVNKPENEITYADLLAWQNSLSNKSSATVALNIAAIKSYFKHLQLLGEIDNDPAKNLEKTTVHNKEKNKIPVEDMRKIIDNLYTAQSKAMVALIASTGMRYAEAASITLQQYKDAIEHNTYSIKIIGKGNKERTIYINAMAQKYIDEYLNKHYKNGKATDKLFVSIDPSSLRKSLILAGKKANLPYAEQLSPHWLRMFWATNAHTNGVDLATIRDALGHSNIAVTSRYIKSCDDDVKNAMFQDMIFDM